MTRSVAVALTILLVAGATAWAADGTWIYDGDGNWSDATKWLSGAVADGVNQTAYFTADISDFTRVSLDSDRTIGHLQFSDPQGWWLKSAGAALTLQTTAGAPTITVSDYANISAPIRGSQGFEKLGSGELCLSGDGTYTGITTVSEGGISVGSGSSLGATGGGNHTVVADGAYVELRQATNEDFILTGTGSGYGALLVGADDIVTGGDITLAGDAMIGRSGHPKNISFTGDISLPGSAMLTIQSEGGEPYAFHGTISGTGGLVLEDGGATLYAANPFSGDTVVNGSLELMNNDALQNSTVQMNQSALHFDSTVLNPRFGGLAGLADLDLSPFGSTARALTVGGNDQDTTYAGSLQGAGSSLIKTGDGTLTLTGSNTYGGGTAVNDGTLVAGNNSALGTGSVQLDGGTLRIAGGVTINSSLLFGSNGGTLGGNGTYLGDLIVGAKGIVSPGNSPGLLTIDGDYTQQTLSLLKIELGGTLRGTEYDALVVTGDVTLAGALDVVLYGGFNPLAGNSFDILDWGTLNGTFDTVDLPALSSGLYWDTSALYTGGVLSVLSSGASPVPVPGALLLGLLGTGWAGWLRSRRSI